MIKYIAILLTLNGCATMQTCPSVEQEPVSWCRAEVACAPTFSQKLGVAMSGANARHMSSMAMLQAESCKTNHIEMQKSNAGLKLMGQALQEQTGK